MSRDFDNIIKEIVKNNKELDKMDDKISKNIAGLEKDIAIIKKDMKTISSKLDGIFDMLSSLSVFIEDAENIVSEDEEEYTSNEGWLPELNKWENEQDDEDED
jgi:hypothetical protein